MNLAKNIQYGVKRTMNGVQLKKLFEVVIDHYCKFILKEDDVKCQEMMKIETGCGLNDNCKLGENCEPDSTADKGYICCKGKCTSKFIYQPRQKSIS